MPLTHITKWSCYFRGRNRVLLPTRMAKLMPDAAASLDLLERNLLETFDCVGSPDDGLFLSDAYRSPEEQSKAHQDWKMGRKSAYSPPSGGSWHEVGRAIDIDVAALPCKLGEFWTIARRYGWTPIIPNANPRTSECWHFERRGTHALVPAPWRLPSAWLDVYGSHKDIPSHRKKEYIAQLALYRMGFPCGAIDGIVGPVTERAMSEAGCADLDELLALRQTVLAEEL